MSETHDSTAPGNSWRNDRMSNRSDNSLGRRLTAADHLLQADSALKRGNREERRLCLERALALTDGDPQIRALLIKHHLDSSLPKT